MVGAEHGDPSGLLLHIVERDLLGGFHAGFSRSSRFDLVEYEKLQY
jgi:hypothetical protein